MEIYLIIMFSIVICYQIYFEKIITKKVPVKRKRKIFELLKIKFEGVKENNLGFFELSINNKNILFEYKTIRHRNGFSNILKIYLDISTIEEDIKKLCRIHFYCTNIENRDWVEMPVESFFNSLNNLVKNSSKTIHKIISETEIYISEKRIERDKKELN